MTVLDNKDHQSACAEKALQQTNKNHLQNEFAHFSPAHTARFFSRRFFLVGAFLEKRVDYSHGFSSVFF